MFDRPKQGFSVPLNDWLNSFLKEELFDIINEDSFFKKFNLNKSMYSKILNSYFLKENKYNPNFIWSVYCLYKWNKRWL